MLLPWLGPPYGEKQHPATLTFRFSLRAQLKRKRITGNGRVISPSLARRALPLSLLPGQFHRWIEFSPPPNLWFLSVCLYNMVKHLLYTLHACTR